MTITNEPRPFAPGLNLPSQASPFPGLLADIERAGIPLKKPVIGSGGLYPAAMTAKLQVRSYAGGMSFLPDPT